MRAPGGSSTPAGPADATTSPRRALSWPPAPLSNTFAGSGLDDRHGRATGGPGRGRRRRGAGYGLASAANAGAPEPRIDLGIRGNGRTDYGHVFDVLPRICNTLEETACPAGATKAVSSSQAFL